jgi:hypothetical protein
LLLAINLVKPVFLLATTTERTCYVISGFQRTKS